LMMGKYPDETSIIPEDKGGPIGMLTLVDGTYVDATQYLLSKYNKTGSDGSLYSESEAEHSFWDDARTAEIKLKELLSSEYRLAGGSDEEWSSNKDAKGTGSENEAVDPLQVTQYWRDQAAEHLVTQAEREPSRFQAWKEEHGFNGEPDSGSLEESVTTIRNIIRLGIKSHLREVGNPASWGDASQWGTTADATPSGGGVHRPRTTGGGGRSGSLKKIQKIIGTPDDGVFGPNTQAAWVAFVDLKFPSLSAADKASLKSNWAGSGRAVAGRMPGASGPYAATWSGMLSWLTDLGYSASGGPSGVHAATTERETPERGTPPSERAVTLARGPGDPATVVGTSHGEDEIPQSTLNALEAAITPYAERPGTVYIGRKPRGLGVHLSAAPPDMLPRGMLGIGTGRDNIRQTARRLLSRGQGAYIKVTRIRDS